MQNSLSMGLYMDNATIVNDCLNRAFGVMAVSCPLSEYAVITESNVSYSFKMLPLPTAFTEMVRFCSTWESSITPTTARTW